jgi:hypothetical protein
MIAEKGAAMILKETRQNWRHNPLRQVPVKSLRTFDL